MKEVRKFFKRENLPEGSFRGENDVGVVYGSEVHLDDSLHGVHDVDVIGVVDEESLPLLRDLIESLLSCVGHGIIVNTSRLDVTLDVLDWGANSLLQTAPGTQDVKAAGRRGLERAEAASELTQHLISLYFFSLRVFFFCFPLIHV